MIKFTEEDIGAPYQDSGPWRSYHLTGFGDSTVEALANATIQEIDQYGAALATYWLGDARTSEEVLVFAARHVARRFREESWKQK